MCLCLLLLVAEDGNLAAKPQQFAVLIVRKRALRTVRGGPRSGRVSSFGESCELFMENGVFGAEPELDAMLEQNNEKQDDEEQDDSCEFGPSH